MAKTGGGGQHASIERCVLIMISFFAYQLEGRKRNGIKTGPKVITLDIKIKS